MTAQPKQLDLFREFPDIDSLLEEMEDPRHEIIKLRKEIVELKELVELSIKRSDNVRRGLFARHNDLAKNFMGYEARFERIESKVK